MGLSCCAVLVNYRDAAEVAAAVASVLADAPGIEVRVVDNSDDDAEWALLRSLLPQAVQCHRAEGNIGFGRGCNLAVRASSADCFFLVNPDVRLVKGCTAALIEALAHDPTLGAIAPRQFLDAALQWRLPPSWLPTAVRAWATERARREPPSGIGFATPRGLRPCATGKPAMHRCASGRCPVARSWCTAVHWTQAETCSTRVSSCTSRTPISACACAARAWAWPWHLKRRPSTPGATPPQAGPDGSRRRHLLRQTPCR